MNVQDMISTLVIGGGIGGLSLARELAVRGLPVTVLEKAPQLNPVGAGIIMNPNAMRVLERNGLAEAVRLDSWPYLLRETCDSRGRSLAMRDYRPLYEAGMRHFTEFLGRGQRVGLVPISATRLYVWTTFNSPQAKPPCFDGVKELR